MPRSGTGRVYQRAGSPLWYGDFRLIGGKRESLGTADRREAEKAFERRKREIVGSRAVESEREKEQEIIRRVLGIDRTETLEAFAAHHLRQKAKSGGFTLQTLQNTEQRLRVAVSFFGADRELHTIRASDVEGFSHWLLEQPARNGSPPKSSARRRTDTAPRLLSRQTVRHYLNALSNLYRRAQAENVVPPGFNPVGAMLEKPTPAPKEARWLEAHEAALILESARTWKPKREDSALLFAYPLIATLLLTGGRPAEVLGLTVEDLSFDRRTITFRPHPHRRLKTLTSHRTVPMHPQLEEVLRAYVFGGNGPISGLLFPAARHGAGQQKMIRDWRKSLDAIAERAGWKAGEVRQYAFRHTYCAARLQTTDRGEAVSTFTVGRELGHGGDALVRRIYGHLGQVRHRAEHVEFRVEHHLDVVPGYAERLHVLAH